MRAEAEGEEPRSRIALRDKLEARLRARDKTKPQIADKLWPN